MTFYQYRVGKGGLCLDPCPHGEKDDTGEMILAGSPLCDHCKYCRFPGERIVGCTHPETKVDTKTIG